MSQMNTADRASVQIQMDQAASRGLVFRSIDAKDQEFLFRVYASTRQEELAVLDWDPASKEAFLRMQFNAQHQYYREQFSQAAFWVIEKDGCPVGRLYLDQNDAELRVIDIALLPEYRGRGWGTALLEDVMAAAQQSGRPVRIHVERFNPALSLYERLGFRILEDKGVYYFMEWAPGPESGA